MKISLKKSLFCFCSFSGFVFFGLWFVWVFWGGFLVFFSGLPYNIPYSLCALCVDILEVYFYSPGAARQKGIRFCDRCQLIKPDRCHHCSVCAICVLKMDHHCPWVNNCIGFSNYKFFLLFLAYALLYCLYIAATVFKYFIKYWTGELTNGRSKFHVLFLLFVAVTFFVTWWQRAARCPARTSVLACGCRKSNRQW
ncbi:palmitoyltransferase ZDHHC15-like isoform X1 [Strix uralensis]|uniref:palmitoyltransferase ZDHHC15-like isoform X1 n=1 Tax=Strix uralensis TaxID=36305 RepID=UPI003DA5F972